MAIAVLVTAFSLAATSDAYDKALINHMKLEYLQPQVRPVERSQYRTDI